MLRAAGLLGLACLCAPQGAAAACGDPGQGPRLGLVLSGGGARGIAHVGVLKALEEQGVRPDCIAGTSMGALVGALYASGYSAARIEQIVRSVDWQRIYSGRAERPLVPVARRVEEVRPLVRLGFGLWHLQLPRAADPDYRLRRMLVALLTAPALEAGRDFDRLPIPFRAVAADLATGERVVLGSGSLEAAVRASVSAPVALEPVREGGRWLVDGGVVDNMPVGVARDMGADVVIAVDTQSPPTQPSDESDAMEVAGVLADVLIRRRNEDFRAEADLVVEPALKGLLNTDYSEFERAIAAGYEAAQGQAAAIADARGRTQTGGAGSNGAPPAASTAQAARSVAGVRVEGQASVHESLVRQAFGVRPGEPFDMQAALRGLDAVWATRLFRSAWLDVLPGAAGLEVVVHVREAEKRVVEVAASFDETDKAEAVVALRDINLFGRGQTLELLGRASDARTALRLTFAADGLLGFPVGYFVRASASEWRPRPFVDRASLARAEFDRTALAGGLQTHPVASLLLRAGFERARVGTRRHEEAGIAAGDVELATVGGLAAWDTLDDRWDPTRGTMVSLQLDRGVRVLGGGLRYWRAVGAARAAATLGRAGTLQVEALGFTSGDRIPLHEQLQFGGPVLVPGFARDELWGPHGGALALSHRVRVVGALQVVARAGMGGVWTERSDVSIGSAHHGFGLGLRHSTPVGPLALEWGRSGGRSRVYLSIGYH